MRILNFILPILALMAALAAGIVLTSGLSQAKPDYTKKERRDCVFCHQGSWTSGQYTDAGQYYKDHHTLKGYKPDSKGK